MVSEAERGYAALHVLFMLHAALRCGYMPVLFLVRCLGSMTSAIPPRMAMEVSNRRSVTGLPRNTMLPPAARTGTLSCTVAALGAFIPRKAVYHMAY